MSVQEFIEAMPKVDLNIQLTGALKADTLLMIANQNGVPDEIKNFDHWVELLNNPDYDRIDEIAEVTGKWVKYPEDIAHVVYDLGVSLSKQNVQYAEVVVSPSHFMETEGIGIEVLLEALNDGRDRALRGWNVKMSWIFAIPYDNPRVGDDVARWATGATARKGNVVAIGLSGKEETQPPVGQFRRAFQTARKKEIGCVAPAGSLLGAEAIMPAIEELQPDRLTDSWGAHDDADIRNSLIEHNIPLVVSLSRAVRLGQIESYEDFPLHPLYDDNVKVLLSSGMPSLYKTSLTEEYLHAHEACGLSVDEIIEITRNGLQYSFLDDDDRNELVSAFDTSLMQLRGQFLTETT